VMEVLGVSGSLIPNSSNWAGLSSWLITHARSTGPSLSNSSRRLGVGFSSWRCTLQRLGIPQGQSGVEGWDWDSSRRADRLFPSVRPAIRYHISICSLISVLLSQPDLASGPSYVVHPYASRHSPSGHLMPAPGRPCHREQAISSPPPATIAGFQVKNYASGAPVAVCRL